MWLLPTNGFSILQYILVRASEHLGGYTKKCTVDRLLIALLLKTVFMEVLLNYSRRFQVPTKWNAAK